MFSSNPIELIGSLGTVSIIVLLILLAFSVSSWGIIIYKWRMFRAVDLEEHLFLQAYEQSPHLAQKEFDKLRNVAKGCSISPSRAIFLAVLNKVDPAGDLLRSRSLIDSPREGRGPDRQYLEKVARYIVQGQISQQEMYLPFLATTGNITPFIGLFGTVVGVINAFRQIGVEGTASIAAVAPGVSEALVATAAGLFAAIPAVIAYNYFLTRIRKTVFGVEAFSIEFLNAIDGLVSEAKEAEVVR